MLLVIEGCSSHQRRADPFRTTCHLHEELPGQLSTAVTGLPQPRFRRFPRRADQLAAGSMRIWVEAGSAAAVSRSTSSDSGFGNVRMARQLPLVPPQPRPTRAVWQPHPSSSVSEFKNIDSRCRANEQDKPRQHQICGTGTGIAEAAARTTSSVYRGRSECGLRAVGWKESAKSSLPDNSWKVRKVEDLSKVDQFAGSVSGSGGFAGVSLCDGRRAATVATIACRIVELIIDGIGDVRIASRISIWSAQAAISPVRLGWPESVPRPISPVGKISADIGANGKQPFGAESSIRD